MGMGLFVCLLLPIGLHAPASRVLLNEIQFTTGDYTSASLRPAEYTECR